MSHMFPSKLLRSFALGITLLAGASSSACSSDGAQAQTDSLHPDIVREGTTTTAALNEFLGAIPDDWGWAGGQFTAPMDMDTLPAATPEAFTWEADPTAPPGANDVLDPSKQQGQVYLLIFSAPSSEAPLLRVFTSLKSYTPDADGWAKLVAAGAQTITLSVTSGTFENDALTNDGGPHAGQVIHFTLD